MSDLKKKTEESSINTNLITGIDYAESKGLSDRTKFVIKKIFGSETKTVESWEKVLIENQII